MDTIASRYASALLDLGIEYNKVQNYQEQMKYVHSIIKENNDLVDFLKCYTIDDKNKKELINKIFSDSVDQEIIHFIYLLIDKKRINYLVRILDEFNSECNNYRNVLEGIIYSVDALSIDTIKKIEENVTLKLNRKVELKNVLDSSLIGGVKIVVNDTVFDNSIASRMQSLKQELISGKDAK